MRAVDKGSSQNDDGLLRTLVWGIAAAVVYLQALSLLHALNNAALTVLPLAVLAGYGLWRMRRADFWKQTTRWPLEMCAVVAAVGVVVYANAIVPPIGFDVWAYHLPYVISWMKLGWAAPYFTAFSGPVGYYPGNFELLALPPAHLFSSGFFYNSVNLVSLLVLAAVVGALARKLEVRAPWAILLFVIVLLTSKVTRRNLGNGNNDLFMTAMLIAGFYFAEEFFRSRAKRDLILAGLAVGLAAGTKYAALLYGLVFLGYFVWRTRSVRAALLMVLVAAIPCAYWYLRNLLITGSPIYPQGASIGGMTVFAGRSGSHSEQLLVRHLLEPNYLYRMFSALVTNGHLLVIPLAVIFILRKCRRPVMMAYWWAGIACYLLYLVTPLSAESPDHVYLNFRYALPSLWFLLIAGGLAVTAGFPLRKLWTWLAAHDIKIYRPAVVVAALLLGIIGFTSYRPGYAARLMRMNSVLGRSWVAVDSLGPARIAYTGHNTPGPLYGASFQNDIFYVNINAEDGANYHAYGRADYRGRPDPQIWIQHLRERRIQYVWCCLDEPTVESVWLREYPQHFAPVYEDAHVRVFRFTA